MKRTHFKIEHVVLKNGTEKWYLYEWRPFEWTWNIAWLFIQVLFLQFGWWRPIPAVYQRNAWKQETEFRTRNAAEERIRMLLEAEAERAEYEEGKRVAARTHVIKTIEKTKDPSHA